MRYFLSLVFFLLLFCHQASAKVYHPDFDCSRMDRNVPGQVLVCSDSDSARSSLILDQAYYALRHQSPAYLLPQLKDELLDGLKPLYRCFPPIEPEEGGDSAHCYRQKVERLAAGFRSRLTPRAYQEASRPIDEHIALQRRLAALGYLRQSRPEGVYGETTRRAILRWQEQTGRPDRDGFLGDDDAQILIPSLVSSQPQTGQDDAAEGEDSSSGQAVSPSAPAQNNGNNNNGNDVGGTVLRLRPFPRGEQTPPTPAEAQSQSQPQSQTQTQQPQTQTQTQNQQESQPQSSPSPAQPSPAGGEGAEIVPPEQDTSSASRPPDQPAVPSQADQGQAAGVQPPQGEATRQDGENDDAHQDAGQGDSGIWHMIKAGLMAPVHLVVWLVQMIVAAVAFLIHGAVWLFLLPFRFVAWVFHFLVGMVEDIFSGGHYLVKFIAFCVVAAIGAICQADDDEVSDKDFTSEGEKEAYYNAATLWFAVLEATEIEEFRQLLTLMKAGKRREAFAWLEAVLQREVGAPAHDILKELAKAREEDTWQAFLRFSITMRNFLEDFFGSHAGESEEAEDQHAREEAYRRAQREGRPPPEEAPWYIVLEVSEGATAEEITKAYRRLIKLYHPDRYLQKGEQAYAEAQKKSQKLTEAYRYARTLERFAEQAGARREEASGSSSSSPSYSYSSRGTSGDGLTAEEAEAYKKVGMLWAGWISEFSIADGTVLLEYLVAHRLRDAFAFLEALARSVQLEQARSVQDSLAHGHNWQDFERCSYLLRDLLSLAVRAAEEEARRQQEQRRAEEAERKRQQQERARRQRARSSAPRGRPWYVVLEVSETATMEEIRLSYKLLIKRHHPDRFAQESEEVKQREDQKAAEINQAYEYIKRYRKG